MNRSRAALRGVTLIELMFAITILAILIGLGGPSFANLVRDNRVTGLTNDFVGSVALARSEAMKRGLPVSLCPTADGVQCAGNTNWATGWLMFTDDLGVAGQVDAGDEILSVTAAAGGGYAPPGYALDGAMTRLTIAPNGLTQSDIPAVAGVAPDPSGWPLGVKKSGCTGEYARRVVVTALGRVNTRRVNC